MVNITDCRSVATGSIPVQTAEYWMVQLASISEFDSEDVGSSPTLITKKMLALAYQEKRHFVTVENRVRVPESTNKENTTWCNRQHDCLPLFLRGKHKMIDFSSNLKVVQKMAHSLTDKMLRYERSDTSSILVEPTRHIAQW